MKLMRWIVALFGMLLGYSLSYESVPVLLKMLEIEETSSVLIIGGILGAIILGLIFYLFSPILFRRLAYLVDFVDIKFQKIPMPDILVSILGLVSGLVLANLLTIPLIKIPLVGAYLPIISNVLLGYLGILIAWKKRDELTTMLSLNKSRGVNKGGTQATIKILDTSVIIDGRIADICSTGIIEGIIGVPIYVLHELQHIADSADHLRRNRGRRGLDVLNRIQKELGSQVKIFEKDYEDIIEVDSKLVRLAQDLDAKVITNDYNLNKVCKVQGVPVFNINELANAVKPVVLPGEEMVVLVIKEGKEHHQGVAYLEDGTMIVVEGGRSYINQTVKVVVTSVLQTAAGRMIFTRLDE